MHSIPENALKYICAGSPPGVELLHKGYTLATPARCKRCGEYTVLSCDTCDTPVCANHSRVTTDMARLCLSCLGAKVEVRA